MPGTGFSDDKFEQHIIKVLHVDFPKNYKFVPWPWNWILRRKEYEYGYDKSLSVHMSIIAEKHRYTQFHGQGTNL